MERTILTYTPRVTCILLSISNAVLYMWEVDRTTLDAVLFANMLILAFLAFGIRGPGELPAPENKLVEDKAL